ncbi:hypothetical protein H5410_026712 [Solanum commersonii]|uniref:Uncharacterized protein n=1 Tax=Solanum commersonii TaxID=4109 RepID=A0A9J5Z1F8_SOLCO|nr:hypothetical protein H5410_026712 [Solanum commersonii]
MTRRNNGVSISRGRAPPVDILQMEGINRVGDSKKLLLTLPMKRRYGFRTTGSTGSVLVTGFIYRNRVLPEPILPEINKGSTRSLSYRIGADLDRTGTGSYRIIGYL